MLKNIEDIIIIISKTLLKSVGNKSIKDKLNEFILGENNVNVYNFISTRINQYCSNINSARNYIINKINHQNSKYINAVIDLAIDQFNKELEELKKEIDSKTVQPPMKFSLNEIVKVKNIDSPGKWVKGFEWIGRDFDKQIIILYTLLDNAGIIEPDKFDDFYKIFSGQIIKDPVPVRWMIESPNKRNSSLTSLFYFIWLCEENHLIKKFISIPQKKTNLDQFRLLFYDKNGLPFRNLKQGNYLYKNKSLNPTGHLELERIVMEVKVI
ncbi:MAG: hypothetical protein Q8880_05080 [Bacteroidota bacterium]|nr:hypothetical protein [Bacteroidota bacterium]